MRNRRGLLQLLRRVAKTLHRDTVTAFTAPLGQACQCQIEVLSTEQDLSFVVRVALPGSRASGTPGPQLEAKLGSGRRVTKNGLQAATHSSWFRVRSFEVAVMIA